MHNEQQGKKLVFSTWNVGKEPELWLWIFAPNHSSEYLALFDSLNLAWGHCMHCWVDLTTMLVMTERSDWEERPTWFEPELCSVVGHLFSSWIGYNEQIVGGKWEHLAGDPVQKIFNFHLWRKYSFIPREAGDMESESEHVSGAERGASGERSVRNIVGARSGFLSKGRSDRSVSLLFHSNTAHTTSLGHAQIHPEFTCAFNN